MPIGIDIVIVARIVFLIQKLGIVNNYLSNRAIREIVKAVEN